MAWTDGKHLSNEPARLAVASQSWGRAIRPKPESACPHCRAALPTRSTDCGGTAPLIWHPTAPAGTDAVCLSDAHSAYVHADVQAIIHGTERPQRPAKAAPAPAPAPAVPALSDGQPKGWGKGF